MTVTEARRLKALERENTKLKRLVAEYALDIVALKDVVSKKWYHRLRLILQHGFSGLLMC